VRYFVVLQEDDPVAVVFHDHLDRALYCRSKTTSFLSAFEAICSKNDVTFVQEGDQLRVLRAIHRGVSDYDWAENALDQLPGELWSVGEIGNAINSSIGIDSVIQKYLS